MSICDECVFKYVIAERRQDACAYCDGEVEAVKACVSAHISGRCERKMSRADVKELVRKNEEEQERQACGGWKTEQSIGKTVFLTREEAEEALAEMKGGAGDNE